MASQEESQARGTTISSLAFLKVNWDQYRKDYLDNFVPLLAECIRTSEADVVSQAELQTDLRDKFGLNFPLHAIKVLLPRLLRHRYISVSRGVYKRDKTALKRLDFKDAQQKVLRIHESIVGSLVKFSRERLHLEWTEEGAESALLSFLESSQTMLLTAEASGSAIPPTTAPKSARYVLAAFVRHLRETGAAELENLDTVVKGNMLANALFLPNPTEAQRRFKQTDIYFDTFFLIASLGYAGKFRHESCLELLHLLYETGANLRCFRHNLNEARDGLLACSGLMKQGHAFELQGPIAEEVDYFIAEGFGPADIELFAQKLEDDLDGLRIAAVDRPEYGPPQHVIDEQGLTEALRANIRYRKEDAMTRDVDSLSAIGRLRKGEEFYSLENCRAIFVTTNDRLVRTSREFFYKDAAPNAIPPCISDYTLANTLWLKKPTSAPALPRKRIIADCYAALQPADELWTAYHKEVGRLQESGKVKEDDYFLLRYAVGSKTMLMDLTMGEPAAFSEGTVTDVLDRIKAEIASDLRNQVEAAENAAETAKAREKERLARLDRMAQRSARNMLRVILGIAVLTIVIGLLSAEPWALPAVKNPLGFFVFIAQVVVLLLVLANLVLGTTVRGWLRGAEVNLENKFRLLLGKLSGE